MDALRTDNLSAPLLPFLLASVLIHLLLAVILPIVAIDVPPPVLTAREPMVAMVDLDREGFTMPLGSLRMQVLELAFPAADLERETPREPAVPVVEERPPTETEVVPAEPEPVTVPALEPPSLVEAAPSAQGGPGLGPGSEVAPDAGSGGGGAGAAEGVVTPPMIVSMAWPEFPREARRQIKVPIVLAVHVDEAGEVTAVKVETSSGCPACEEAAIASAWRLRFAPATRGGEPIPMWTRFPVTFGQR